jgi:hypothetical protein
VNTPPSSEPSDPPAAWTKLKTPIALAPVGGEREDRDQHAEYERRGHRASDALEEAGRDQSGGGGGEAAGQ